MFLQLVSTSPPSGETIPRPVTTTRRIKQLPKKTNIEKTNGPPPWTGSRSCQAAPHRVGETPGLGLVGVDILDGVADRRDLLGGVVGNLDPELLLEGHDELDDVEAVG